ncbi:MAG: hypothetical protein RLY71_4602, partial [Pseudomonadota bacterium]
MTITHDPAGLPVAAGAHDDAAGKAEPALLSAPRGCSNFKL